MRAAARGRILHDGHLPELPRSMCSFSCGMFLGGMGENILYFPPGSGVAVAARATGVSSAHSDWLGRAVTLLHWRSVMASPNAGPKMIRSFNLSRWFAVVGLASIATISGLSGWAMSRLVTNEMLKQEGALTQQFVQTLVLTERSLQTYFASGETPDARELELALAHISRMTDMLRANVYNRDRRVIWSSDQALIGERFGPNDQLEEALSGNLVVHSDAYEEHGSQKAEHRDLQKRADLFVEIYVPVRDASLQQVIGVIEFYRNPQTLFHALVHLKTYIAFGAALAGGFLYLALAGLVARAGRVIRAQERRLIDSETLAAIGEMSSAVAHGIRNPLASIRSSAELIQVAELDIAKDAAGDIVAESDRLEAWVNELLSFSRPLDSPPERVHIQPLVTRCLHEFSREMARRRITHTTELADAIPAVRANALMLGQVLHSLVANALEAMNEGGTLSVHSRPIGDGREVMLAVGDSGPGMSAEQLAQVGKPFYTTKRRGLGVGLSQVRRIVERYGGRIEIESAPGEGTSVRLFIPAA